MKIPFNILDFLDRAENIYGDRIGVSDEPDQRNRIARRRACRGFPGDSFPARLWRRRRSTVPPVTL
jgi:hypothetical protein